MATVNPTEPTRLDRAALAAALAALVGMFLVNLGQLTFVDPDLWHEMALARETLQLGRLPLEDRFSYTPTVYPVVHHEWGAGFLFYGVAQLLGAPGIMALKYALSLGVGACCFLVARRRGASQAVIITLAPAILLAGCYGFTTIRAQLLTMFCLGLLLWCLELDRTGRRWWMIAWLPVQLVWLNVHAGFVVGLGLFALYTVEQAVRRQPFRHLVLLGAALGALVLVNPYGADYVPYLLHALSMPRPMIIEWRPLWQNDPGTFSVYLLSVLMVAYAWTQLGLRRMQGLLVWAATAYAALSHTRHLSLYFVVWLCFVPAWLQQTRLGDLVVNLWQRRRTAIVAFSSAIAVLCLMRIVPAAPWQMKMPNTPAEELTGRPMYPTGAVDYLGEVKFSGNLMVPFVPGGYVMWKLHPAVKVSLDGRYEVAYQHGLLEQIEALYQAEPGWQETLARYPSDAILVPRACPLAGELAKVETWRRCYRDGAYDIYTRADLTLPELDRGEATTAGQFP
ncbi:MAG: hypothetical protein JSS27_15330 [Planctomycetes bacterium]|nr:hypothetical protein [Planctomycetota bacterium]